MLKKSVVEQAKFLDSLETELQTVKKAQIKLADVPRLEKSADKPLTHDCQMDDCCRQDIYALYAENKKANESLRQKHMELANKFTTLMDKVIMQSRQVSQSPQNRGNSLPTVSPKVRKNVGRFP